MGIKVRHPRQMPLQWLHGDSERMHQNLVDMQNLTKLLGDHAPGCCREQKIDNYFGRKIAIDASMHIYQFLVRCQSLQPEIVPKLSGNESLDITSIG